MDVKIVKGTSKAGREYECIQVKIGEYETRVFPSRAEIAYIKGLLRDKAHKEFQEDEDVD